MSPSVSRRGRSGRDGRSSIGAILSGRVAFWGTPLTGCILSGRRAGGILALGNSRLRRADTVFGPSRQAGIRKRDGGRIFAGDAQRPPFPGNNGRGVQRGGFHGRVLLFFDLGDDIGENSKSALRTSATFPEGGHPPFGDILAGRGGVRCGWWRVARSMTAARAFPAAPRRGWHARPPARPNRPMRWT